MAGDRSGTIPFLGGGDRRCSQGPGGLSANELAHQLKTPIAIACNQVELVKLLATDQESWEQAEMALENMHSVADQITYWLEGGPGRSSGEVISVGELSGYLRAQIEGLRPEYPNLCPFEQKYGDREVYVSLPALQLVLDHLIDNAYYHGRKDCPIDVRLADAGSYAEIQVSNIPIYDRPPVTHKVLQRGVTHSATGRGLGLHIVKRYVESMGAELDFYDSRFAPEDGGQSQVSFYVRLTHDL